MELVVSAVNNMVMKVKVKMLIFSCHAGSGTAMGVRIMSDDWPKRTVSYFGISHVVSVNESDCIIWVC